MSPNKQEKQLDTITNQFLSRKDLIRFMKINIDSMNESWKIKYDTPNKLGFGFIGNLKDFINFDFNIDLIAQRFQPKQPREHWTNNPKYQTVRVLNFIIEKLEEWISLNEELQIQVVGFIAEKNLEKSLVNMKYYKMIYDIFEEVLCKERPDNQSCIVNKNIIFNKNREIRELIRDVLEN